MSLVTLKGNQENAPVGKPLPSVVMSSAPLRITKKNIVKKPTTVE